MSVHALPDESQRIHWYSKLLAPVHEPALALTTVPWAGVELAETVGAAVLTGTSVCQSGVVSAPFETCVIEPPLVVIV